MFLRDKEKKSVSSIRWSDRHENELATVDRVFRTVCCLPNCERTKAKTLSFYNAEDGQKSRFLPAWYLTGELRRMGSSLMRGTHVVHQWDSLFWHNPDTEQWTRGDVLENMLFMMDYCIRLIRCVISTRESGPRLGAQGTSDDEGCGFRIAQGWGPSRAEGPVIVICCDDQCETRHRGRDHVTHLNWKWSVISRCSWMIDGRVHLTHCLLGYTHAHALRSTTCQIVRAIERRAGRKWLRTSGARSTCYWK